MAGDAPSVVRGCGLSCHRSPEVFVACGYYDSLIKVWSVGDGRHKSILHGHNRGVKCMVMCDGRLISGSDDGTIKQWDINGARCLHTVEGAHDGELCEWPFAP